MPFVQRQRVPSRRATGAGIHCKLVITESIREDLLNQIFGAAIDEIGVSTFNDLWLYAHSSRSRNSIDVLLSSANGPQAFIGGNYGKKIIRR